MEEHFLTRDLLTEKRRSSLYALLALAGWAIVVGGAYVS